jgi:hypothetical protein
VAFVLLWSFDWLHERWEEAVIFVRGGEGFVIVDTPQLYTRERLVNDRFREAAWLEERLLETDDLLEKQRFSQADLFLTRIRDLDVRAGKAAAVAAGDALAAGDSAGPALDGLRAAPEEEFDDVLRYREIIRNSLMDMQLDDRHDIAGNTIYRLNFHGIVMPGRGERKVAAIVVGLDETDEDYSDLLHDWKDELQRQVLSLVDDKTLTLTGGGDLIAEEQQGLIAHIDDIFRDHNIERAGWREIYGKILQRSRKPFEDTVSGLAGKKLNAEQLDSYRSVCARKVEENMPGSGVFLDDEELAAVLGMAEGPAEGMAKLPCLVFGLNELQLKMDAAALLEFVAPTPPSECEDAAEVLVSVLANETGTDCAQALVVVNDRWASWGVRSARQALVASFVADELEARAAETEARNGGGLELGHFFDFPIDDCRADRCYPVVRVQSEFSGEGCTSKMPSKCLKQFLSPSHVATYSVTPSESVQRLRLLEKGALAIGMAEGGAGLVGLDAREIAETVALERQPTILGIGDWGRGWEGGRERFAGPNGTKFAWIVLPRRRATTGRVEQAPDHVSMSAIVSVPSWWKRVKLTVATCWLEPISPLETVDPNRLCPRKPQDFNVELALPGDASDVMTKLRFEVLTFPYLLGPQHQPEGVLEVGREASLTILGGRLWRSPKVIMGNQLADRIEVLPDMQGIVAHFDCIDPYPGTSGDLPPEGLAAQPAAGDQQAPTPAPTAGAKPSALPQQLAIVWTSEGRTAPRPVQFAPYRQRVGEAVDPCWLHRKDPR